MKQVSLIEKISFNLMALEYKIKSLITSPENILKETNINKGDFVVDYGCGPGRYTIPIAKMVGDSGKVYAVDINPLAFDKVNDKASKENLTNIELLDADNINNISDNSIDVVILYDTLHDIKDMRGVIKIIARILKTNGYLSFKDHTLKKDCILTMVEDVPLILDKETKETIELKKI